MTDKKHIQVGPFTIEANADDAIEPVDIDLDNVHVHEVREYRAPREATFVMRRIQVIMEEPVEFIAIHVELPNDDG